MADTAYSNLKECFRTVRWMSSINLLLRRCSHFKDLPACLNTTACESRIYYGEFLQFISILATAVCCVGVLSNTACLFALLCRHRFARDTTHRLIVTGASADLLVILTSLLVSLESFLPTSRASRLNGVLQGSTCTIISCLHLFRTWIALLVGFERYLLVRRPLFFRAHWNLTTVNILLFACVALVLASRVPLILNVVFDLDTWHICEPLAQSVNAFIDLLIQTVIPLVILPLMSLEVFATMKSSRWCRSGETMVLSAAKRAVSKRTTRGVHKAMLAVLLIYIILLIPTLPGAVLRLLLWFGGIQKQCKVMKAREIMEAIAHICSLLISSVDFYIYLICWPRFREPFLQALSHLRWLIRCAKGDRRSRSSTHSAQENCLETRT